MAADRPFKTLLLRHTKCPSGEKYLSLKPGDLGSMLQTHVMVEEENQLSQHFQVCCDISSSALGVIALKSMLLFIGLHMILASNHI